MLLNRTDILTATVRLTDRFGDNGLISVFVAHSEMKELIIDIWLMSCRVLKRGVEQLLSNYVVEQARRLGVTSLKGAYYPTPKNSLVRDHFQSLGYEILQQTEGSGIHWRLALERYQPIEVQIAVQEDNEVGRI